MGKTKSTSKALRNKFKKEFKIQMESKGGGGGGGGKPGRLSERQKAILKWCKEERVRLWDDYDGLQEVLQSLDRIDDRLVSFDGWIQEMRSSILKQKEEYRQMDDDVLPPGAAAESEDSDSGTGTASTSKGIAWTAESENSETEDLVTESLGVILASVADAPGTTDAEPANTNDSDKVTDDAP